MNDTNTKHIGKTYKHTTKLNTINKSDTDSDSFSNQLMLAVTVDSIQDRSDVRVAYALSVGVPTCKKGFGRAVTNRGCAHVCTANRGVRQIRKLDKKGQQHNNT